MMGSPSNSDDIRVRVLSQRVDKLETLVKRLYKRFGCHHGTLTYDQYGMPEHCKKCGQEHSEWMNARMSSHP